MELKKGQNMIEHEEEIHSRPARTWFQSEKEKTKAQGNVTPGCLSARDGTDGSRTALSKEQYETGTSSKKDKEKKAAGDKVRNEPELKSLANHYRRLMTAQARQILRALPPCQAS